MYNIKLQFADWCVVQLSVVSVGLPWKQMILTRFVKDKDPVILKLPGFSSPQVKKGDFTQLLLFHYLLVKDQFKLNVFELT